MFIFNISLDLCEYRYLRVFVCVLVDVFSYVCLHPLFKLNSIRNKGMNSCV